MSLRAFHIAFIVVATVLTLVVTAWGVREFMADSSSSALAVAVAALATGVALIIYGTRFFAKLQELA